MKQGAQSETARLFIALWPDQATRAALQSCRDAWAWPKHAHLSHADSLHITLHFLGDVSLQAIPALVDALQLPFAPFDLTLNHQQIWTNGIAVLEPEVIPVQLLNLHRDLGRALQSLSMPTEQRPYRPHVTFARRANGAVYPQTCAPIRWRAQEYALMQSRLAPPRGYQALQIYR